MTPRSVASIPKDIAPPRPAAPPPASAVDFSQLIGTGAFAQMQASNGNGASSSDSSSGDPPKAKTPKDDPDASTAAAAATPAPAAPPPQQTAPAAAGQSQTATSPQSQDGAASAATATQAQTAAPLLPPLLLPALPADGANAPSNKPGDAAGASAQTSAQPPGAAELQAQITVSTPTFLSQPNTLLAGLWHHGATANDAPQADPAQPDAADSSGDATANASPTAPLQKSASSAAAAILAQTRGDPQRDSGDSPAPGVAAITPDAANATGTGAAAAAVSAPVSGDTQSTALAQLSANPAPMTPAHVLPAFEQVAVNLKQAAQSGTDRIEIQLKPASLGAIQVKLDVTHDGHITAVISADRSDTLNMLRQDASGLEQALRDAGLKADSNSLSFNLRGDPQSFAQNSGPSYGAPAYDDRSSAAPADALSSRLRRHDGALDIEV